MTQFLLEEALPKLFCEVMALECTNFDALVKEFQNKEILVNFWLFQVEEQVLIFVDNLFNKDLMFQAVMKF